MKAYYLQTILRTNTACMKLQRDTVYPFNYLMKCKLSCNNNFGKYIPSICKQPCYFSDNKQNHLILWILNYRYFKKTHTWWKFCIQHQSKSKTRKTIVLKKEHYYWASIIKRSIDLSLYRQLLQRFFTKSLNLSQHLNLLHVKASKQTKDRVRVRVTLTPKSRFART
jgi:hypothetical protein